MTGNRIVNLLLPQVQLECIQSHGGNHVDPPPNITTLVTTLHHPPLRHIPFRRSGGEVLHQETGIHSNEDTRTEPAHESQNPACPITVIETKIIGDISRVPYSRDDSSCGIEDEDSVCQRDENRGCDRLEGGVEEGKSRVHCCWQGRQQIYYSRVRCHDDRREWWKFRLRWRWRRL